MRLIKNEKTESYHEIEVERSFLWFKWRTKYRRSNGWIFVFKEPNNYYTASLSEYIDVAGLFKINPTL